METIFTKLGYKVSKKRNYKSEEKVTLLSIANSDGSPRWIWNSVCNKPIFLKFYNVGNQKASIYAFLIKMIFFFRLQKLFFKSETVYFSKSESPLFNCNDSWALFTGTVGPNNKALLFVNGSFYKIATTTNAQSLLKNEHTVLKKLNYFNEKPFIVPQSTLITDDVLKLTDVSVKGKRSNKITASHLHILKGMSAIEKNKVKVKNWKTLINLTEEFNRINDERIPFNMIRKINLLLERTDPKEVVETSISHGDFTPWNMFVLDNKLGIYDWELSSNDKSLKFDYFHYFIQKGILIDRRSWKEIYYELKQEYSEKTNFLFNQEAENEFNKYLKWYLVLNCMHYLSVYSKQTKWHKQVDWLLQTWNEGLNEFLTEEKTAREMIIMDLFDCIQNKEYATLKYINGYPEQLPITSDIDMVTTPHVDHIVIALLRKHKMVSKITYFRKSFMNTIQVTTNQGDILSLDLIWQLKVKNLTILNATKIIKGGYRNFYGVKAASIIDATRFIAMFYALNGAKIPKKYRVYEEVLVHSTKPLDLLLQNCFTDKKHSKKNIVSYLLKNKQNQKMRSLKNTLLYITDTVRGLVRGNGFTITFSGVDGAGKSTIIENAKIQIEKQLRKPVIVLRHRPSILPILSVWTKGKEKAHSDVINNLPRQGNNTFFLSSLFRFSYYYTDYVLGQFVVYFKYILRGKVVIYDRYYFDFINDSKRSNIVLPKFISQLGYAFLLKPKFNFFLFADAETILQRKQELNKSTIEKLTIDYHLLFKKLQDKSYRSNYNVIKNEQIDTTLNQVLTTIKHNQYENGSPKNHTA